MAGLFYAWSISVTLGLANVDDQNYLSAFKAMNRAILNPVLFLPLVGLVILLPLSIYLYYASLNTAQLLSLVGATACYLLGVMAVTVFGNVPLNDTLEALPVEAMSPQAMADFRSGFETRWNNFNTIRTVSSSISLLLLALVFALGEQG